LTSKGFIWVYPGKEIAENSIQVLPENSMNWLENFYSTEKIKGICTDFPIAVSHLMDY
jgi:hypothetical protein